MWRRGQRLRQSARGTLSLGVKREKTKPCSLLNRAPATRICKRVLRPVALRQEGIISAGVFDLGRLPELRIVFHEPLRGANSFPFQ